MNKHNGMSLIELMVAIAIGSLLLSGLVATFKGSSDSYRELQKASDLIENGRYAIDVLYNDIRHAGYFGHYPNDGTFPASIPDPCETASDSNLLAALPVAIQGYTAANLSTIVDITSTTCDDKGILTTANLQAGSDVLVIRRSDTELFAGTDVAGTTLVNTGTTVDGEVYIQTNAREADIQIATNAVTVDPTNTASGKTADNATATLQKMPGKTVANWADTRKYNVHVYFVAPCNSSSVCTSADIPTLKRLELGEDGSGGTTMNIVPLVEGIEYFKVHYGIDTTPTTVNTNTGLIGDGVPDSYIKTTPTLAQLESVVAVKAYILARSLKTTVGYTDSKSYTLGNSTLNDSVAAANDSYKRHVYGTEIRPVNISGRREDPE